MSRLNNTNRDINKAIFSALKESAQAEASRWESEELPSTTNGTARQEIEDQLERTRNRKERVGIEESSYKDKDEAEYYRNKELYANSNLARHREAMNKAAKKCKEKGIKLDESAPYRRYRVSFYVDTNEMNNMDIEERLNEVLKGSGLASADETIDVEMIEEFEESSLKEAGEWDDNDEDMQASIEDLRTQAEEIASEINGEVKIVKGFDAYQGPFAIISTPKHGDVEMWYDQEDDTGRSFSVKVAHVGWISGDTLYLADLLKQDKIPDNEILSESSLKEERVNMRLRKGDTFMNDAGVKVVITDVDEEHLLDGEPQVTYYFSNYGANSPEDYKCFKMSSVVSMLNQNSYKRVD